MLTVGKDLENDATTYIEIGRSRAVLICGKRGSGKSYTMGVLVEELLDKTDAVVVIVDPMGIYHTMSLPNRTQERDLWEWGMQCKPLDVMLFVPGDPEYLYGGRDVVEAMQQRNVSFQRIRINPCDLSPDGWCDLFDMNISEPMGMVLYRAVQALHRKMRQTFQPFTIPEIITEVDRDRYGIEKTKEAVLLRLETAIDWGIFSDEYHPLSELFQPKVANVLDLSVIDPGRYGLRNLIVDVVCRNLFRKRTADRRREELDLPVETPPTWLAIDEAHQFAPSSRSSLAKETLIRWVKEGRQPGLSLIVASQQPSAVDKEILSQCDLIVAHKITSVEDMQALNQLSHDYMSNELRSYVRRIDRSGVAVIVDDEEESVHMVRIQPRRSQHGGGESAKVQVSTFQI